MAYTHTHTHTQTQMILPLIHRLMRVTKNVCCIHRCQLRKTSWRLFQTQRDRFHVRRVSAFNVKLIRNISVSSASTDRNPLITTRVVFRTVAWRQGLWGVHSLDSLTARLPEDNIHQLPPGACLSARGLAVWLLLLLHLENECCGQRWLDR